MTLQGHIIQSGQETLEDEIIRLELSIISHEMQLAILKAQAGEDE